ncbi:MAG: hypothetical protein M0022_02425 [Desulfobacteraceae bacterium]|nr:hypothetical protein [Desulfobacteraceae bacterium]
MTAVPDGKTALALGQILMDLILLFIIFFLYRRLKALDTQKIENILAVLKKSEKMSQELEKNLKKNEELTVSLYGVLNKNPAGRDLKKGVSPHDKGPDASRDKTPVGGLDPAKNKDMLHDQVIALWKIGKNISEIASATGLTQGEVEIIISIAKTANNPSIQ